MSQLKRYNGTSWENVGGSIAPSVIWTGTLKGGDSISLSGVKKKLIIYAVCVSRDSLVYTLDLDINSENVHGGATVVSWDTSTGLEYYISEARFTKTGNATGNLAHIRTGFMNISSGTYSSRNSNNQYYIYKIETSD